MPSSSWIPKWDRGRAQAHLEPPNPTSVPSPSFSNRGSRSSVARQAGRVLSGAPAPVASSISHVQVPDSVGSSDAVIPPSTHEQNVATASSAVAVQYMYDFADTLLPFGLAAAAVFPPAKAALGCVTEIINLVHVSFCCLHDSRSRLYVRPALNRT